MEGLIDEKDNYGNSCLLKATKIGKGKNILKWLLDKGSSVEEQDNKGNTCLFKAVINNDFDTTKFFLERGSLVHKINCYDKTCLDYAVENFNFKIIELLIKYSAPHFKDDLLSLLILKAVQKSNLNLMKSILDNGGFVCFHNFCGCSCITIFNENKKFLDFLLVPCKFNL